MDLTTFLILLIIFIIIVAISTYISNPKDRIAYFMVVGLCCLVMLNFYITIVYYIKLRNDTGIAGPPGPKGAKGPKGDPGKCTFSNECGIQDARTKILNIASDMYNIPVGCIDKPSLAACNNNSDMLEQASAINTQVNMLESIAYKTTMAESDFLNKLSICLTDPATCNANFT